MEKSHDGSEFLGKTMKIIELPKGKKLIECKWVFTIKYKGCWYSRKVKLYEIRFVTKGYTQTYGDRLPRNLSLKLYKIRI